MTTDFRHVLTALAAAALLAACSTPQTKLRADEQFEVTQRRAAIASGAKPLAEQADANVLGGALRADAMAASQRQRPVARRADKPFIGSQMVPVTDEDRLPPIFGQVFTLDFSDAADAATGGVSITVMAARLSKLTGVPVRVQTDVFGDAGKRSSPTMMPIVPPQPMGSTAPSPVLVNGGAGGAATLGSPRPPAVAPNVGQAVSAAEPIGLNNVEMRHSGTLSSYLNNVTDRLGLAWEYRDNTVVIIRFVNEVHEIETFGGAQDYAMSSSGSGGGQGGVGGASNAAAATMDVRERGSQDAVTGIEKAIASMLLEAPGSSVTRVDGSGRLMVKTSRELQSRIREFVRSENVSMRRQAQIQFDIYSIITDDGDERGINWGTVLQKAGESVRMAFYSPPSLATASSSIASIAVLPNVPGNRLSEFLADSSLMVQALSAQGYSAQHRQVPLIALNRQWSRLNKLSTEYYLAETTPGPATSTGVGAPGLKTDKVTTGDQYVAMPQILNDNTVLLKFGMSLSDLLGLFDVSVGSGSTAQKVQAPRIQAINIQFPVALRPGEIAAITGLSRRVASEDTRRIAESTPIGLGGSRKVGVKTEHFIVFVRPILL